jgi:hypothetical protein
MKWKANQGVTKRPSAPAKQPTKRPASRAKAVEPTMSLQVKVERKLHRAAMRTCEQRGIRLSDYVREKLREL